MNKLLIPVIASVFVLGFVFLQTADASIVDTITDPPNPSDVAVNSDTNLIYVTNRNANTVSVIDGTSNTVIDTIFVGNLPTGVALNPDTNMVYVTNSGHDTVSVIDANTNTVVATLQAGLGPSNVAVNPDTNLIYVVNNGSFNNSAGTVTVIDGATNTVIATISTVFPNPLGVTVNPDTNLIYFTLPRFDFVSVIDGTTNSVIGTIPVGNFPFQIAMNSNTNLIYVTNLSSNFVSVIDATTNAVVDTIPVQGSTINTAVDSNTNIIYLVNSFFKTLTAIDGNSNTVIGTTLIDETNLFGIDINRVTELIFVTSPTSVYVLDNNFVEVCDGIDNDADGQVDEGCNEDPICSTASASQSDIWPANNKMTEISVLGVTDPDGDNVAITITGITQDEPTAGNIDGDGVGTDTAQVRAQSNGNGNGRVYEISFSADDGNGGMCTGSVNVGVPHDQSGTPAEDSGQNYNSLN